VADSELVPGRFTLRTIRGRLGELDRASDPWADLTRRRYSLARARERLDELIGGKITELTGGGPRLLDAADEQLRRGGLRPAGRMAKLQRALAGQLPPAAGRREPTPRSSAAEVVLAYAAAQVAALTSLDPLVRHDEPDAVHQMRVATRRLRSTLTSFGPVLRREDGRPLGEELKWLGGLLGTARDAEVLAGHLQAGLEQMPPDLVMGDVQARVRAHFAPVEADARAAVLQALDSDRYMALPLASDAVGP